MKQTLVYSKRPNFRWFSAILTSCKSQEVKQIYLHKTYKVDTFIRVQNYIINTQFIYYFKGTHAHEFFAKQNRKSCTTKRLDNCII
jgi:hypothetical protein